MLTADSLNCNHYIQRYENSQIEIIVNMKTKPEKKLMTSTFYISYEQVKDNLIGGKTFKELIFSDLSDLSHLNEIEILIVGTGEKQLFPTKELYKQLGSLNFSVDFMRSDAACRTFNILVNENRKVGALLFLQS